MPGESGCCLISGKKKIVITSAKGGINGIKAYIKKGGCAAVVFPMIEIRAVKFRIKKRNYDWVVFTSKNAAEIFIKKVGKGFLKGKNTASIGGQTTGLLEKKGLKVSFTPHKFNSMDFLNEFIGTFDVKGKRFLLPVSSKAGRDMGRGLRGAGASVDRLVVYENTMPLISARTAGAFIKNGPFYFVLFASPSAFGNFIKIKGMRKLLKKTFTAAIGPATASYMKKRGVKPEIICAISTMKNAVDDIINYKGGKK
jgi:uroporphyrinogen-III synthase